MTQDNLLDNSEDIKSYREFYVGEGKKYADDEGLGKAYYHLESHAKTLEAENTEYRKKLQEKAVETQAAAKLEELINKYDQRQQLASNEQQNVKEVINQPATKPEQLESLVSDLYKKEKTKDKEQTNFDTVKAKLIERFGPNYQNVVSDQLKELGMSVDELNSMARRNPNLVYRTLGVDKQPETFQAPPKSGAAFRPTAAPAHNKMSHYLEMKKTNPRIMSDPKIQKQMETDALFHGEAFFDA